MGSQGPVTQEGLHDSEEDLNIELSDNEAEDVHLRPSAGSGTAIIEKVASQAPGESRSEQPQTQSDSFEGEPAWKKAELDEAELDIEVIVSEDEESDTATEIKHEAATSAGVCHPEAYRVRVASVQRVRLVLAACTRRRVGWHVAHGLAPSLATYPSAHACWRRGLGGTCGSLTVETSSLMKPSHGADYAMLGPFSDQESDPQ